MLFFRNPFGEKCYTVEESSTENPVSFVGFNENKILNFSGKIKEISAGEILNFTLPPLPELQNFTTETQAEYEKRIAEVIKFIEDSRLKKLVVARQKAVFLNDNTINFKESFLKLCQEFPNAFCYIFMAENQCWMGAFSELLGKFNKKTKEFSTMSLAGTLPANEDWTPKEIEEQKPVTDYISGILNKFSVSVSISGTKDHISGKIKHLRNDFSAKIESEDLEKLIAELHPTPAVCGIPKDFCRKAIARFEDFDREFYAGYIRVEDEDFINYYVNLRCAKFYKNAAIIFAGGGITPLSQPGKEWRETELKSDAILKNLSVRN